MNMCIDYTSYNKMIINVRMIVTDSANKTIFPLLSKHISAQAN